MRFLAGAAGLGLAFIATSANAQVGYMVDSEAWRLMQHGGRIVATTPSTAFIRGRNGRMFECDVVESTANLKESFGGRIRFSGQPLKLISTCIALGER